MRSFIRQLHVTFLMPLPTITFCSCRERDPRDPRDPQDVPSSSTYLVISILEREMREAVSLRAESHGF